MTAVSSEVAVRAVSLPAQVMHGPGAALGAAVAEFLAANKQSRAASEAARLQDSVVADEEAERLHGVAEDAWQGVVREASASGTELFEDVLDLGWGYSTARPQVSMPAPAVAGDWRESVAAVNWSRSRS